MGKLKINNVKLEDRIKTFIKNKNFPSYLGIGMGTTLNFPFALFDFGIGSIPIAGTIGTTVYSIGIPLIYKNSRDFFPNINIEDSKKYFLSVYISSELILFSPTIYKYVKELINYLF